jgi:hypothetical protein
MDDLTTYRVPPGHMSDAEVKAEYGEMYVRGGFRYVKDTRLQAIADADRAMRDTMLDSPAHAIAYANRQALLDALQKDTE